MASSLAMPDFQVAWTFLNSNFWTSLVGSGAGAIAGAWAAQAIADRRAVRSERLEQVRHLNAAIAAAVAVGNVYTSIKRQHVAKMATDYAKAKKQAEATLKAARAGSKRVLKFSADFEKLSAPSTPIHVLGDLILNKINAKPNLITMYQLLAQSVEKTNESLDERNKFIEWVRSANLSDEQLAQSYFGLKTPAGHIDKRYPDLIDCISTYIDECLVFSRTLAEDLAKIGAEASKAIPKGEIRVAKLDFSSIEKLGLMPDLSSYKEVLRRARGEPSA